VFAQNFINLNALNTSGCAFNFLGLEKSSFLKTEKLIRMLLNSCITATSGLPYGEKLLLINVATEII